MYILFAFGSALFAGATAILAKVGIKNVDSYVATALRTIIVLIFSILMVFVVGSQGTINTISTRTLIFLVLSGMATGASWLCYFRALQIGDVNKVVPIDKSSTLLTMILAFIFLGEGLTVTMIIGMLGIGLGTYFMVSKKQLRLFRFSKNAKEYDIELAIEQSAEIALEESIEGIDGSGSKIVYRVRYFINENLWIVYASLSAIFASFTSILAKVGIENVESNLGTAIRTVVVLIMAWIIVFVTKKQGEVKKIDKRSLLFIGLSGIATGLSWLCYFKALQIGPASIVVPIDKLSIVVTVAFAYIFFKEKLSKKATMGLALIVAGTLALLMKV